MKTNAWMRLLLGFLAVILTLSFAACIPLDQPDSTESNASTEPHSTQEPSQETTAFETESKTDAPTGTGTETESDTESESETETEPDDGIPLDAFTIGGVDITSFTLVVQDGGAACVRDSADELMEYLEKATGFRIEEKASEHEIVIGVTDRDTAAVTEARAKVELDGYTMLTDGGRLYITCNQV